jgi:hypothetical protein
MKTPKVLTAAQRKLWNEAVEIAELGKVDFWNIEEVDKEFRLAALRLAIAHMVVGEIVTQYTLMDEILSEVICKYFFRTKDEAFVRWKTKKFRTFVHHISNEMYLIKKMELVHAIKKMPSEVRSTVHKLNMIRNAMAHSFFPENRKEHRSVGKVLYEGKDIRSSKGFRGLRTIVTERGCIWLHGHMALGTTTPGCHSLKIDKPEWNVIGIDILPRMLTPVFWRRPPMNTLAIGKWLARRLGWSSRRTFLRWSTQSTTKHWSWRQD